MSSDSNISDIRVNLRSMEDEGTEVTLVFPPEYTVAELVKNHLSGPFVNYIVQVSSPGQPPVRATEETVLKEGDKVTASPTNIKAAV